MKLDGKDVGNYGSYLSKVYVDNLYKAGYKSIILNKMPEADEDCQYCDWKEKG